MAAPVPGMGLNRTRFVHLVGPWNPAPAEPSRRSFAERISQWLDWTDAISLCAALNAQEDGSPWPSTADKAALAGAAEQEITRVRATLTRSIHEPIDTAPDHVQRLGAVGVPPRGTVGATDISPYRRHYLAQQRAMETAIEPLRENLRHILSGVSPQMRQLATLDRIFEKALSTRERHLLSGIPARLARYFEHLRGAPLGTPASAPEMTAERASDDPRAGHEGLRRGLQELLQAELELRLRPVEGLLAALRHAATSRP